MKEHPSPVEKVVAAHSRKTVFHDNHDRREYLRAVEIAQRIIADPAIVRDAEQFLERHVRNDPHQLRYYLLWKRVIASGPTGIVAALLEDSDLGAELRSSAPVFVVIEASKNPPAEAGAA